MTVGINHKTISLASLRAVAFFALAAEDIQAIGRHDQDLLVWHGGDDNRNEGLYYYFCYFGGSLRPKENLDYERGSAVFFWSGRMSYSPAGARA